MNFGFASKRFKKAISLCLALATVASMSVTAFAGTVEIGVAKPAGVDEYIEQVKGESVATDTILISEKLDEVTPSEIEVGTKEVFAQDGNIVLVTPDNKVVSAPSTNLVDSVLLGVKGLITQWGTGDVKAGEQYAENAGDPWENLTYKGGLSEYFKRVANEIIVHVYRPVLGSMWVDGFIVGKPWVAPQPNTNPAPQAPVVQKCAICNQDPCVCCKTCKQYPCVCPPEVVKCATCNQDPCVCCVTCKQHPCVCPTEHSITDQDKAAIETTVKTAMRYAVSAREASKVKQYVYTEQLQEVETFVNNKNTQLLSFDQNSVDYKGISAINNLMNRFIIVDKFNIESIVSTSGDEYEVKVNVPVIAKFATMSEDIKKALGNNYDMTNVKDIHRVLSNPVSAKTSINSTIYEATLNAMNDYYTQYGTTDMYLAHPDMFSSGTMTIRMKKINNQWCIDKNSMVIDCTIDGATGMVTFFK